MPNPNLKSAYLKVDRAAKHVSELNELLREKRPFRYILETNTKAQERSTYAEQDEAVVDEAALIGGDVLQALRSALDHAYWEIVSPHVPDERGRKAIQFPFSETKARLEEAVKNRLAQRVSPEFFDFIIGLRPHGEAGGNQLLYLLHDRNATDKHRTLIPTADYKTLDAAEFRRMVPDFPAPLEGSITIGGCRGRDIVWEVEPWDWPSVRYPKLPGPGRDLQTIIKQELDVPVEIVFQVTTSFLHLPLVPTLQKLVGLVRAILNDMERFCSASLSGS